MNKSDRAMLDTYGYIDRRTSSTTVRTDAHRSNATVSKDEEKCRGCAATSCPCARHSTASSRRPETLRQARDWQKVKESYLADGFCEPCAVTAAYGHGIGFSQVPSVCQGCSGKRPTYRWAGEQARRWSGAISEAPARLLEAA